MKFSRRFVFAVLMAAVFSFSACAVDAEKEYLPVNENVKLLGRSVVSNDVLLMCFSGTGAAFEVNARRLDIELLGDSNAKGVEDTSAGARIGVFVNGECKLDKIVSKNLETVTVFDEKKPVTGEVRIIKLSESANSQAGLSKILVDKNGTVVPAAKKDMKIEFIGDSITCGYGVDDLDRNHHFATSTEDATKTYAYKTAESLGADWSMVCASGFGVVSGYTNGPKNTNSVLPKYYDKIGFAWGSTILGKNPKTTKWDFNSFVPDVVVINLGTNDNSYVKKNEKRAAEFEEAYVEFLRTIREKNPDAKIVCSLGLMGADLYSSIEKAAADYKKLTGDEQVYTFKFSNQNAADGIAADWHPSEKTHEKAAFVLTSFIRNLY